MIQMEPITVRDWLNSAASGRHTTDRDKAREGDITNPKPRKAAGRKAADPKKPPRIAAQSPPETTKPSVQAARKSKAAPAAASPAKVQLKDVVGANISGVKVSFPLSGTFAFNCAAMEALGSKPVSEETEDT